MAENMKNTDIPNAKDLGSDFCLSEDETENGRIVTAIIIPPKVSMPVRNSEGTSVAFPMI